MKTKGHWPKGKRRNDAPAKEWTPLRRILERRVRDPEPGRSRRGLARELGVDVRTVCRWLAGEDWPQASRLPEIKAWIESITPRKGFQ